jgi:hypothetical protein
MIDWAQKLKNYYEEQLKLGPGSKKEPPKKPENNLDSKILGTVKAKRTQQTATQKKAQKQMSGMELNDYLAKFYQPSLNVDNIAFTVATVGQNLDEIAANLKLAYQSAEFKSLKTYFELGGMLSIAKARFDERKIVEQIQTTWKVWVEENTGMSPAYCRRVRSMFDLMSAYPKLQFLRGITFTELFKLSSSIESTFKNPDIARKWL